MYEECYRNELLPCLTPKWLESSPPNTKVDGLNPRGLKCADILNIDFLRNQNFTFDNLRKKWRKQNTNKSAPKRLEIW